MEDQFTPISQFIEITNEEGGTSGTTGRATKICGEAPCGLSDPETSSKDAKERSAAKRKLIAAVALCLVFMSVEIVGGIKANSLAILTDAAHLLSDVAAFSISLLSLWAAGWDANPRQSYGFSRAEILGALVSIQLIWVLAGILVYEAIVRLVHGSGEVNGFLMFVVAAFGLVVNVVMALLLGHDHGHHSHGAEHDHHHHHQGEKHPKNEQHRGCEEGEKPLFLGHGTEHSTHHHHQGEENPKNEPHSGCEGVEKPLLEGRRGREERRNINVQGAYLHVLGDSIQSVGVMIGGAIIWYKPEWKIVDLICTLLFSAIVLGTTVKMLRSVVEVLMESTPREVDAAEVERGLLEMGEVVAVHELHIWAITVGKTLMACHVKIRPEANADVVLENVIGYIRREYNITHVTIQIER